MKRTLYLIPMAVAAFFPAACRHNSGIDASKFTVEIVAGIRHIANKSPQLKDAPPVTLQLIGKIGELEGREDKDILYDPVDAARLPNGDILVLEGNGSAVKRFNKDHHFLSSFGRKGAGPGDFASPYLLRLDGERKKLYVADGRRISRLSPEGSFIGSFMPRSGPGGSSISDQYQTSGLALLSGSRVILPSNAAAWDGSGGPRFLLSIYNEAGEIIRSFGNAERYDDLAMQLNANVVYFSTDGDDNTCVSFAFQNRIDKYSSDGTLVYSSSRHLPYEIKTEMRLLLFRSGSVERKFPWPSVTSVSKGCFVDRDNRLWVLTFLKQPDESGRFDDEKDMARCYEFEVFDADGILQFVVPCPNVGISRFSIYDDRMYIIDSKRESCVYEFKIAGKI
ncbi:MAG: hypothetical protein PHI34_06110 [Acidobacteriota bacterium]|nr:hypothetical protein [Acidobacteriota bacterium]